MSTSVSGVSKHFPSAENGFTTTLSGSISSGAVTVGLNSVAGYTNGEVAVFVVDPTDAAKKQTFTGTIDTGGVQVTDVVWTAGTNQTHAAGATVVDYATATHISMMTKGLLVEHAQTGLHTLTSSATITSSKVITGLNDTNGNEIFKVGATGSAVNELTLTNAATGNAPIISATGGDTNIGLTLTPKGTGNVSMTSRADGWVTGLTAPAGTITALGNRSYTAVVSGTDYTDRLSAGMRLRLTRTVTAPTQCTDLEAGSSHYFSKTSPNKLTFTDDFTVSAWIKLESYATMGIIARRNADTEGWSMGLLSDGRLQLAALRIAGNNSITNSYQSIPLGRWVHVAATANLSGTSTILYIDGIVAASLTTVTGTCTAIVQGTTALVVGAEKSAGTNPFDGKIAQAAVFDAVLSASTIRSYMSQGLAGTETNLLSAYSLSNSITDLMTTTPNDLSAVNSAVATATDTPFSGGSGGTTEYGVITAASFSTDTTLTIQVPEGYAIPTSGGLSAMAYSTQSVPQGFPAIKEKWRLVNRHMTTDVTTSNATFGAFQAGGWHLTVPVGAWDVGYQGGCFNATTTSVYFNLSSTALTGMTVAQGVAASPFGIRIVSPAAATMVNSTHIKLPQNITAAATYVMYTFGATASAGIAAGDGLGEVFAEFGYL